MVFTYEIYKSHELIGINGHKVEKYYLLNINYNQKGRKYTKNR